MGIAIDPEWYDRQIDAFSSREEEFKQYADTLEIILSAVCRVHAPLAIVQTRPKSLSSFAEKVVRKAHKYDDPVNQLTDLCGARIITQTKVEVDRISQFIHDAFIVDEANSVDKKKSLGIREFGYLSVHYVIQLPMPENNRIMGVTLPKNLVKQKLKAEIQVRTLLQHAWASISHDSLYKNMFSPPRQWHREMNRLAASLEGADRIFADFVGRMDTYSNNHGAYLSDEKRAFELNTLELIHSKERNPLMKSRHAMRIAMIHKAVGNWQDVVRALKPYEREGNASLLGELGYAVCRGVKDQPGSAEYARGMAILEKSCEMDPDDPLRNADMAWALRNGRQSEDLQKARAYLARAYALKPSDPYYLSAYLESEILTNAALDHIDLLRPSLLKAIETCRAHAQAGIEVPWAHFTMGRLYLLISMPDESLFAYLNAIDLCLCEKDEVQNEFLLEELDFLFHLESLNKVIPGYDAALRLMLIARYVKAQGLKHKAGDSWGKKIKQKITASPSEQIKQIRQKARKSILELMTPGVQHQAPVTLVAGSCAASSDTDILQYKDLLTEAFANYNGSVFSGGTFSGVSRLVGDLGDTETSPFNVPVKTVAYLPKRLPINVKPDLRYSLTIETPGNDFSPMQPLQMWIDLLGSGIVPDQIKLLGIGGGTISAFEYRLALTLGVQTGIIEQSGREADKLIHDADWNCKPLLLPLVKDRMTVKNFLSHPVDRIEPEKIDALARITHDIHREEKRKKVDNDQSLKPWTALRPDYQESNRDHVRFSVEILKRAGFDVRDASPHESLTDPCFSKSDVELMVEMEHGRWNVERLRSGWRYGIEKDEDAKISPCLVSWEDLSDEYKDYDYDLVCSYPELLWKAGLIITRKN